MSRTIKTPAGRVSYPAVFKPREPMDKKSGAEPNYEVTLIFPKGADLSELTKLAEEAARLKWGDKIPKPCRNPIRNQSEKFKKDDEGNPLEDENGVLVLQDGYEHGGKFIIARNKRKPFVVGPDQALSPITDESEFYGGVWAHAAVSAMAYDTPGNRGVRFNLKGVQKIKDDEAFGGSRITPEEVFQPIAGAVSNNKEKLDSEAVFGS